MTSLWSFALIALNGAFAGTRREDVTPQEILDLAGAVMLTTLQRQILSGAFHIAERTLREVLVPRPGVVGIEKDTPAPWPCPRH